MHVCFMRFRGTRGANQKTMMQAEHKLQATKVQSEQTGQLFQPEG